MWNNNINTYACCAGHDYKTHFGNGLYQINKPYISFDIKSLNDEQLESIIKAIKKDTSCTQLDFSIDNVNDPLNPNKNIKYERHNLSIHLENGKDYSKMVEIFKTAISNNFHKLNTRQSSPKIDEFISAISILNKLDFKSYQKIASTFKPSYEIYRSIELEYFNNDEIIISTDDNAIKYMSRAYYGPYNIDNYIKEGMCTYFPENYLGFPVTDKDDSGYFTVIDGAIKKISKEQAADLVPINSQTKYKLYSSEYSRDTFIKILKNIKEDLVKFSQKNSEPTM